MRRVPKCFKESLKSCSRKLVLLTGRSTDVQTAFSFLIWITDLSGFTLFRQVWNVIHLLAPFPHGGPGERDLSLSPGPPWGNGARRRMTFQTRFLLLVASNRDKEYSGKVYSESPLIFGAHGTDGTGPLPASTSGWSPHVSDQAPIHTHPVEHLVVVVVFFFGGLAFRPHVSGVNSGKTKPFENALQSGKFWKRRQPYSGRMKTELFENTDVAAGRPVHGRYRAHSFLGLL